MNSAGLPLLSDIIVLAVGMATREVFDIKRPDIFIGLTETTKLMWHKHNSGELEDVSGSSRCCDRNSFVSCSW